ncbi:MAG: hypothetical protein O7D32_03955 [bacterium]|nr:hypothetical protein [bacterium]
MNKSVTCDVFLCACVFVAGGLFALNPPPASHAYVHVSSWTGDGLAAGPGEIGNLHGIVVDAKGIVYVADTANRRIQRFRPR